MMRALALILAAYAHEPSPDDFARFGLPLEPGGNCVGENTRASRAWRDMVRRRHHLEWTLDPVGWRAVVADAEWRYEVWTNAAVLADTRYGWGCPDDPNWWWGTDRLSAARRLRALLGAEAYYLGVLPSPWPEGE